MSCSHFFAGDSYIISEGGSSLSRSPLLTIEAVRVSGCAAVAGRGPEGPADGPPPLATPGPPTASAAMHGNQPLRRKKVTLNKEVFSD
ncbi:hypothetical protein RR46_12139 [Papilio xuthus]|uniref:Uncharacterized protein n=1 Tax=Papilio xuthus TaxID=66420 RepID=A0A194PVI2_PAPXU|nr:hypothetical protein RR46_12139 [Papilio xuthus]